MYHDDAGAPWVMPSPNMPTLDTRDRVPGNRAVRGNERLGGPRHDAAVRADRRAVGRRRTICRGAEPAQPARRGLPAGGVRADVSQAREKTCGGCQIHVTDRATFRPVLTGVLLTEAFRAADRGASAWRQPPYEYEHEKLPFDILAGSAETREQIEAGVPAEAIARSWDGECGAVHATARAVSEASEVYQQLRQVRRQAGRTTTPPLRPRRKIFFLGLALVSASSAVDSGCHAVRRAFRMLGARASLLQLRLPRGVPGGGSVRRGSWAWVA